MGGSGRKELVTQVQEGQFQMEGSGDSLTTWPGVSVAPDDRVSIPNETVAAGMNRGNPPVRPHGPR